MKPILLLLISPFILLSCVPHQYFALSGENIKKEKNKDFIYENDTLKVVYNFNSQGCPVNISIFNKLNEPLKIDWLKSAIIYNNKSNSYYNNTFELNANVDGTTARTLKSESPNATHINEFVNGHIVGKEKLEFIPPNASITRASMKIPVQMLEPAYFDSVKKNTLKINGDFVGKYKSLDFRESSSPIIIRSYLTYSVGKNEKEFFMEHRFYVSKAWQTAVDPSEFVTGSKEIEVDFFM